MPKIKIYNKIDEACKKYKIVQKSKNVKFIKLDEWLDKESDIFVNEIRNNKNYFLRYKRGQLIKVDFGVNVGSELSHTHFAIVLNSDDTIKNDNITVLPLTSKKGYKRVFLGDIVSKNYLSIKYLYDAYGMITQIKTISKKRILLNNCKYICEEDILQKIDNELIKYLIHN